MRPIKDDEKLILSEPHVEQVGSPPMRATITDDDGYDGTDHDGTRYCTDCTCNEGDGHLEGCRNNREVYLPCGCEVIWGCICYTRR